MADVLFIVAIKDPAIFAEVNGTLLLATKLLEAGIDADILRFCQVDSYLTDYDIFIDDIVQRIQSSKPKAVSFYTLWPYYHIMLRIAKVLKERQPDIAVVFGGPQSSATAEATMEAMPFIDYICTGEGENTVVPFFSALLSGQSIQQVPGLWYRAEEGPRFTGGEIPLSDLDTLPHWDDRLYLHLYDTNDPFLRSKYYYMPIDAGRGCPYNCTFCCSSHFWKRTYRLKSPQRIVSDIRYYNEKFGIRSFWFSHDAFTTKKALVAEVCDHILKEKLDICWKCTARIDCISEDLILKMKQAGMIHIELGIETGSPRMQKLVNKNLNLERAKKMTQFLLDNGLTVGLFFMYGFPEETEEDLAQTMTLLFDFLDMGVNNVSMSYCKFNPATAITDKYFDQLVLDPDIKIIDRGIFGFDREFETIRDNKTIFPFYFHLDTPVRRNYQYLHFLAYLYEQYRLPMKQLRRLYRGDDLRLYRDFYNSNLPCFEKDIFYAQQCVNEQPLEMLENTMDALGLPCIPQLKGLLRFLEDLKAVTESTSNTSRIGTYNFDYKDYQAGKAIEDYRSCTSQLLLCRAGNNVIVKTLSCR